MSGFVIGFGFVVALYSMAHHADALMCYQCDSWENKGCSEDNFVDQTYFNNCTNRNPMSTVYCIKEMTTFIHEQEQKDSRSQIKQSRTHVRRRCGSIASYKYRPNSPMFYECDKTNVIVNTIKGERKTCACASDGCNSGMSLKINKIPIFLTVFIASVIGNMYTY